MIPAVVRVNTDTGSGSGVIAQIQGNAGYVVTNQHVVQGTARVQVIVGDGATYEAEILGEDAVRDLAVLKICCGGFPTARFGDVAGLEPATEVLVVGYPHGIPGPATITQGIVSAVRFSTELRSEVIQTDAATNPGNSGGPIVSLGGEVLGIVTYKFMESEGLGFAVPSNVVMEQLPALWANERTRPRVPSLVSITGSGSDEELEARIQEAIQELMPTLSPTPIPVPQPTPANIPATTFGPTPASLPPTPASTLHPCDLATIPPLDELQQVYTRFMAADPYANSVNTEFRGVLARLFPKISAVYILEFIHDPLGYASFRDYLGTVGYGASNVDKKAYFQQLRRSGVLPSVDESLYDYNQQSDPCTLARTTVFADDKLMTLLAVEIATGSYSPAWSEVVTGITMREIYAFRDRDPATPLIYLIMKMDDYQDEGANTVTTASGLQYEVLASGNGTSPAPGDTAVVHYTGWLTDGARFDSSMDRGRPFEFVVGQGNVIKGWDEGVALMKVGDKWKFTIPPELAYGERNIGNGLIPPNSTLVFEVELLDVK